MPRYRITIRELEWENNPGPLEAAGSLVYDADFVSVWANEEEPALVVPANIVLSVQKVEEKEDILTDIVDKATDAIGFLKDLKKGFS